MKGCIGIADVKEYQIEKPTDKIKERESFSGKKKINRYRMLSVCDHTGRYTYVRVCLGRNDCEVFTSSPLFLQEGDFFLKMSSLLLMVGLKVMVGFDAHIIIQAIILTEYCLT
jgi:hypothetical protein